MSEKTEQELPTPKQLCSAPQLAVLAVLEITAEMARCTLLAQHPDIFDDQRPSWIRTDPSSTIAEHILAQIHSLQNAIQRYRFALAAEQENSSEPEADFPF